jgi:hypothetical protein
MTDHAEANMPLGRLPGDVPKERECLRCKTAFQSEWWGERICRRCKSSASWRNGLPHAFKSSGHR